MSKQKTNSNPALPQGGAADFSSKKENGINLDKREKIYSNYSE